jgi:hypothetical protein
MSPGAERSRRTGASTATVTGSPWSVHDAADARRLRTTSGIATAAATNPTRPNKARPTAVMPTAARIPSKGPTQQAVQAAAATPISTALSRR